jgi:hypothetical protein
MNAAVSSNIIISKFHWFDRLLAGICILFGLFMIAGMGAASTVSVRSIDASLGLLTKETPFYFKNLEKITKLVKGIDANAQFIVTIGLDLDKAIKEVLILAFKFILRSIIKALLGSLRGVMDKLIGSIKTWTKTLSGLLDSTKSFFAALALKVFANQECLGFNSVDVVSDILGFSVSKNGSAVRQSCNNGSNAGISVSVTKGNIDPDAYGEYLDDNLRVETFNSLTDSVGNLRAYSLLYDEAVQLTPGTYAEETTGTSDKGQNTQSLAKIPSKQELKTKKNEIANAIGIIACSKKVAKDNYDYSDWNYYNPECTTASINAVEKIDSAIASDKTAMVQAKNNQITAAPGNCKFGGFMSDTKKNGGSGFQAFSSSSTSTSSSWIASSIEFASQYSLNTVNAEQCDVKQIDAVQANTQSQVAANNAPSNVDSSLDGGLQAALSAGIEDLVNGLTKVLNDFVKSVFQLVINLVEKFFASLPGGEFLSESLTSSLTNSRDDIQNKIAEGLNALRPN